MQDQHHQNNYGQKTIDLSQFDNDYAAAKVEKREYERVPDGRYEVVVDSMELTHARSTGNPMLKWTLRVLGPQCEGRLLWRNNVLATRDNLSWLKGDLQVCGLELARLSDLQPNLGRLLGIRLEVIVRTRGEHQNVYLKRRIEGGDNDQGNHAAASKDDLIPF